MSLDEIVQEIRDIRGHMEADCSRILEISKVLYSRARREALTDSVAPLILYANTWSRFAGAISHGLARTSTADRVLEKSNEDIKREEQRILEQVRRDQQRTARTEKRAKQVPNPSPSDDLSDLIELYGREVISDASK